MNAEKLLDKEYRDAWVDESVKTVLPFQIRAIRAKRRWSQAKLGKMAGMKPHSVSRLESDHRHSPNISTLLRLAHAFDCALLVKFVPFSKMAEEFADVSDESLAVIDFDAERPRD